MAKATTARAEVKLRQWERQRDEAAMRKAEKEDRELERKQEKRAVMEAETYAGEHYGDEPSEDE